ncbi:MAG: HPP family protein [Verrucomicrobia bacterium]|nr:HPP family protein [Verrucomicrobiota bacterium]
MSQPSGLRGLFDKFRGADAPLPPRSSWGAIASTALLAGSLVAALAYATSHLSYVLLLGTFAASSLLIFAYPDSPFSQPRNTVVGHLFGTAAGLTCLHWLGPDWWSAGLAVGLAIAAMKATRTVHPPASSNPLIVFAFKAGWGFLLFPTLLGALLIVTVALFVHNVRRPTRWPQYW